MKLLTKEIRAKLPELYSTDDNAEAKCIVKFFDAMGSWAWYGFEFDGTDLFFGLVDGFEKEWGYFSLSEIESVGARIERDMYYTSETKKELSERLGLSFY